MVYSRLGYGKYLFPQILSQTMQTDNSQSTNKDKPVFRAVRDKNPYTALGRVAVYLMTKPSFAKLGFGHWSRTLTGQINRGHYFFTLEGDKVVGFVGWALVSEEKAKAWAEKSIDFSSEDCVGGESMVINAWAADTGAVNKFNLREIRKYLTPLKSVYAKRFYKDGRIRPLIVGITDAVESHLEKQG